MIGPVGYLLVKLGGGGGGGGGWLLETPPSPSCLNTGHIFIGKTPE